MDPEAVPGWQPHVNLPLSNKLLDLHLTSRLIKLPRIS